MKSIQFNHWYIKDNELSISLMNFYVRIQIFSRKPSLFYLLTVYNSDKEEVILSFPTLEEAVSFTEGKISSFFTLEEVEHAYVEAFERVKQKKK